MFIPSIDPSITLFLLNHLLVTLIFLGAKVYFQFPLNSFFAKTADKLNPECMLSWIEDKGWESKLGFKIAF